MKFFLINNSRTIIIFAKNPAKGGIPAIEKKISNNEMAQIEFFIKNPDNPVIWRLLMPSEKKLLILDWKT